MKPVRQFRVLRFAALACDPLPGPMPGSAVVRRAGLAQALQGTAVDGLGA